MYNEAIAKPGGQRGLLAAARFSVSLLLDIAHQKARESRSFATFAHFSRHCFTM